MKILRYILLVIFAIIYAIGINIDLGMFLVGGLGGPYEYAWVIPLHLILGTILLIVYVKSLRLGNTIDKRKKIVVVILLIIILPLPIIFVANIQYKSDKMHFDYEQTCRTVLLDVFQYKFCPGHAGTFGPGVSVIGYNPGDPKYNEAMKIWDTKGFQQFKSEMDWYYKK